MRERRAVAEGGVELGKVITPMLDLSFNILFFFVVMYHPSALEGHIDGKLLPPKDALGKGSDTPKVDLPPLEEEPVVEDSYQVMVRAVKDGQEEHMKQGGEISQIYLQRPEMPDSGLPVADSDLKLDEALKRLQEELTKALEAPGGENAKIKLQADENLKYGYLMQVYDICRLAEVEVKNGPNTQKVKFKEVSFVGPTPLP